MKRRIRRPHHRETGSNTLLNGTRRNYDNSNRVNSSTPEMNMRRTHVSLVLRILALPRHRRRTIRRNSIRGPLHGKGILRNSRNMDNRRIRLNNHRIHDKHRTYRSSMASHLTEVNPHIRMMIPIDGIRLCVPVALMGLDLRLRISTDFQYDM